MNPLLQTCTFQDLHGPRMRESPIGAWAACSLDRPTAEYHDHLKLLNQHCRTDRPLRNAIN